MTWHRSELPSTAAARLGAVDRRGLQAATEGAPEQLADIAWATGFCMKIQLTVDNKVVVTATLDENPSAMDFAAQLPLSLTLKDYAATEKVAMLPRALSLRGAPKAIVPVAGDISFYAPSGNLAIFYRDGQLSSGLVRLGRIEAGLEILRQRRGELPVRIEQASP